MTNTINNVPRELLADLLGNDHDKRIMAERHLLAMLANAPSPAGVDGLSVVAYRVSLPGEPELGTWLDEDAENEPQMCLHEPLCRLSDALAAIAVRDARIVELEADLTGTQSRVLSLQNQWRKLDSELAAIKAQEPVAHDTKGSRKALGAMNAKLKAKIGRLEREHAAPAAKPQVVIPELDREVFEDEYSGEYGTPVSVLRLLRDGENYIEKPQHSDRLNSSWWMWRKARALLSTPSPAGVDGLEVETYLHTMHMELGRTEQFCSKWKGDPFGVSGVDYSSTYSVTSDPLCRLSDAHAIIDGLRGEVAALQSMITDLSKTGIRMRAERDNQPPAAPAADAPVRQATDGGRNQSYEGLFDGETEEQRASRLAANRAKGVV